MLTQGLDFPTYGPYTTSSYSSGTSTAASDLQYPSSFGSYSMEESQILDGATVVDEYSFINYDGCEDYLMSPISPNLPSLVSTSYSTTMSPDPITRSISPSDAYMDDIELMSDESASDQVLDSLMNNLHAHRNESGEDIFRCRDVDAPDHTCGYEDKRKCNLRKHLESTLRTNICKHPGCNGAAFSSKAVLTRHEKEAHGMHQAEQYFCPVATCERANRPFPREYNMCDHINRVHKDLDSNTFMKKSSRRSKKSKSSGTSGVATPVNVRIDNGHTPRKSSSGRTRREKYEKKYSELLCDSRDILMGLDDPYEHGSRRQLKKLKDTMERLEETYYSLLNIDND